MNALGDLKPARVDLERALALSTQSKTLHQQLRATLTLGSVTALQRVACIALACEIIAPFGLPVVPEV